jgi:hypothetical protein
MGNYLRIIVVYMSMHISGFCVSFYFNFSVSIHTIDVDFISMDRSAQAISSIIISTGISNLGACLAMCAYSELGTLRIEESGIIMYLTTTIQRHQLNSYSTFFLCNNMDGGRSKCLLDLNVVYMGYIHTITIFIEC